MKLFRRGYAPLRQSSAVVAIFALVFAPLSNLVPVAYAAASNYVVTGTITPNGLTVSASGHASATPYVGQAIQQAMSVDWDEDQDPDTDNWEIFMPSTSLNFHPTDNGNNGTILDTPWSLSHTYAAEGTYEVRISLHHANQAGNDGAFSTIVQLVEVTYQCSDGIDNDSDTFIDFPTDPGCTSDTDDDEFNLPEPTLTVTKVVVNNSGTGSKVVSDFPLFIDGNPVTSGATATLSAGLHTISETNAPGYTATISGDCAADGTITLAAGDVKSCTITNDDNAPDRAYITVTKTVANNYGGTLLASDFPLFVNGTPVTSGVTHEVFAAGDYTVSETNQTGYTAGSWEGNCTADGSLNGVVFGGSYTCTITNYDIAPELTVIKHVINDDSGNDDASDFTINVTGTNVSQTSFAGSETGVMVTLDAGSYSVSEDAAAGYSVSYSADCSGTIALGEQKTCTVTNDDLDPTEASVTITKDVVLGYNLADKEASDFTFELWEGQGLENLIDGTVVSGDSLQLPEGNYTLVETNPEGYAVTFGGVCGADGSFHVEQGDLGTSISCTVTNTELPACSNDINDDGFEDNLIDEDDPACWTDPDDSNSYNSNLDSETDPSASITIDKVVIGESANADLAFTFAGDFATTSMSANSAPVVFSNLSTGFYFIGEVGMGSGSFERWELDNVVCIDVTNPQSTTTESFSEEFDGARIHITPGEDILCTFTNEHTPVDTAGDDEYIIIAKEITQGSDTENFTFDIVSNDSGTTTYQTQPVAPGTQAESPDLTSQESYRIVENIPSGWSQSPLVSCVSSLDANKAVSPDDIVLENSEVVTCTYTNDQDRYVLEGTVWEDENENGSMDEGEDLLSGWVVRATNGTTDYATETAEDGTYSFNVPEGEWTISLDTKDGWEMTTTEGGTTHTVTVPAPEEETESFTQAILNWFMPTAHAAIISTTGGFNFGVKQVASVSSSGGGGGGVTFGSRSRRVTTPAPVGEVLGASTTEMPIPVGAPNTGAGGSSPMTADLPSLRAILAPSGNIVRKAAKKNAR